MFTLSWKGMPRTNTLAYLIFFVNYGQKTLAPAENGRKRFLIWIVQICPKLNEKFSSKITQPFNSKIEHFLDFTQAQAH
jgi:hypothetical protein